MSTIGNRILRLRKQQKLSQESLGKLANVSDTYIGKLEKDETNVTVKVLIDVAKALGTSIGYLIYGENNKDLNIVPKEFTVANEAREYIRKHKPVLASENVDKISDEKAIKMANEMLYAIELVSYKYIEKEGNDNEN